MLHHVDTIRWEIERRRNVRSGLTVLHPLLFCLASDTDLQAARITHATAQHMMVRDRIERDHGARSYRWQWTLLPECLDDFIDESNPVRVIDVFVDALDPFEMRFEGVEPAGTGRPSDHPSVLLKLDIYGYLNRVQSRRLLLWSLIPKGQRRNTHPAAAKDYWWSSPWRQYLAERVFRAVPVARQRENRDDDPLGPLEAVLAAGGSLVFFPEGTRGAGWPIQPFKGGLYHLAAKFPHVTLVPVYIDNLNRVLPKGEILPVPIICTVHIGAGFRLDPAEMKADFISRAHSRLEALVPT